MTTTMTANDDESGDGDVNGLIPPLAGNEPARA
jgi:hypothetical protein